MADQGMLELLPGLGPAYAGRIITYCEENGNFTHIEDLRDITGIGSKTMEKLRPNIVVE